MKKIFVLICVVALLILSVSMCSKGEGNVTVTVPDGSSVSYVADILKENGLIKSKFLFVKKVEHTDGFVLPGTYTFSFGTDTDDIIAALKSGKSADMVQLTVPEGFSVELIAKRVDSLGICKEKDFLKAADTQDYDFEFLKSIPKNDDVKYKLQGFLYPNTYYLHKDTSAADVVKIMLGEFEKQLKQNGISYDNLYKAVTVASLLQREALVQGEKPVIAGVIYNRLDKNMLLQIDAAVVYAVTNGAYDVNAVYNEDLKVKSPYNLYKYIGLPPGPICNPDISSIKAAVNPQKHDYLYYRTDETKKDGSHIFTKTYREHLNANN